MARVLLGWELGAGSGHVRKLADLAHGLAGRGHQPIFALTTTAAAPAGFPLWQAPVWPAQLTQSARRAVDTPATMGDILVALGLVQDGALAGLLRGWDSVLVAARADVVVAEFAPALTLAARGRVPVVALGSGFSLPPAGLDRFPSLTGAAAVHAEPHILAQVNRALADAGLAAIARLPALFDGAGRVPATFAELDPYHGLRQEPVVAPDAPVAAMADRPGDEIFVYMGGAQPFQPDFWSALAARGLPVRMHDARIGDAEIEQLERAGIAMERRPVAFARIVQRSRLAVSYGSLGFASAALVAGLPQVAIPYDIEKAMIAASLADLGVARVAGHAAGGGAALLDLIEGAYHDAELLDAARGLAPDFRSRMAVTASESTVAAIEALL